MFNVFKCPVAIGRPKFVVVQQVSQLQINMHGGYFCYLAKLCLLKY